MRDAQDFLADHLKLTRRYFLGAGAACVTAAGAWSAAISTPAAP